jgi:hypothetical protein
MPPVHLFRIVPPYTSPVKPSVGLTTAVVVDGKYLTEAVVSDGRAYSFISEGLFRLLGDEKTLLPVPAKISASANFIGAWLSPLTLR